MAEIRSGSVVGRRESSSIEEDKPAAAHGGPPTRGVSHLLDGGKSSLVPEGNERMARRRKLQLVDEPDAGGCGGDGASLQPILPLPTVAAHATGNGYHNGNGHAASR